MSHKKAKSFTFLDCVFSDKENLASTPKRPFSPCLPSVKSLLPLLISIPLHLKKSQCISSTPNSLQSHPITPLQRLQLVQWMIEVTITLSTKQSFFASIKILDKYFSKSPNAILPKDLQLSGLACILIASKLHDVFPVKLNTLVVRAGMSKFQNWEIIDCEKKILQTLAFEVNLVTSFDFILMFSTDFKFSLPIIYTCEILCFFVQMDYEMLRFSEEEIAAGCVYFALTRFEKGKLGRALLENVDERKVVVVAEKVKQWIGLFGGKNKYAKRLEMFFKASLRKPGNKGIFKFHDKNLEKEQQNTIKND